MMKDRHKKIDHNSSHLGSGELKMEKPGKVWIKHNWLLSIFNYALSFSGQYNFNFLFVTDTFNEHLM